jgi:hypothetical protein
VDKQCDLISSQEEKRIFLLPRTILFLSHYLLLTTIIPPLRFEHGTIQYTWISTHRSVIISCLSLTFIYAAPSGANREIKKAVEAYWAGKLSVDELNQAASTVKKSNWTSLKERGVNHIPR